MTSGSGPVQLKYDYENIVESRLAYSYTNPEGVKVFENRLAEQLTDLDYAAGDDGYTVTFPNGYGTYAFTLSGYNKDGIAVTSDAITINYVQPTKPEPERPGGDTDEDVTEDGEFSDSHVVIDLEGYTDVPEAEGYLVEVYSPDDPVTPIYVITVQPGTDNFVLPLDDLENPTGGDNYIVHVTPLDSEGEPIVTEPTQTIVVDPDAVADPQDPEVEANGSITMNLGINPNQVDEVTITVTDPNDPDVNYIMYIPTKDNDGVNDGRVNVRIVNQKTGATQIVQVPVMDANGRITIPFGGPNGQFKENHDYTLTITTYKDSKKLFTTVTTFTSPIIYSIPL